MTVDVGDRVTVVIMRTADGKPIKLRKRNSRAEKLDGTVVWAGPKFATVKLDAGWKESFGYDDITKRRA